MTTKTPRELYAEADVALGTVTRATRELRDRLEQAAKDLEYLRDQVQIHRNHIQWQNGVISRQRLSHRALRGQITKLRKRIEADE